MKSTEELHIERHDAVLKLKLTRPARANALSDTLVETLMEALDYAKAERVRLVVFSGGAAKDLDGLRSMQRELAAWIRSRPGLSVSDIAFTLQTGRTHFDHRLAVAAAADVSGLLRALDATLEPSIAAQRPLVFVFPHALPLRTEMARTIFESEPVFQCHFTECVDCFRPLLGISLLSLLYPNEQTTSALNGFTCQAIESAIAFSLQYALARLLASWGIAPSAAVGDGCGEYAVGVLTGRLPLGEAASYIAGKVWDTTDKMDMAVCRIFDVPVLSASSATWWHETADADTQYWSSLSREPRMTETVWNEIRASFPKADVLKIGAHAAGDPLAHGDGSIVVSLFDEEQFEADDYGRLLRAIGRLWARGMDVDWRRYSTGKVGKKMTLPFYPMRRRMVWFGGDVATNIGNRDDGDQLHGGSLQAPMPIGAGTTPARNAVGSTAEEVDRFALIERECVMALGVDCVDLSRSFPEMGGDSIHGARMLWRLEQATGVAVDIEDLMSLSLSQIAERLVTSALANSNRDA